MVTTPLALVDLAAAARNIAAAVGASGLPVLADVRHNAWGHGLDRLAAVVLDAGAAGLLVSVGEADAARGLAAGAPVVIADVGAAALSTDSPDAGPAGFAVAGASLYGLPGSGGEPVLRALGRVVNVKPVRAGEGVSYGYLHRAPADGRLALVTGGYAHGVVRALGNRADVVLNGRRRPIVGRVAMDVCVVDLGDTPAAIGDEVVYLGAGPGEPTLADWAAATGLEPAELLVGVATRFEKRYLA